MLMIMIIIGPYGLNYIKYFANCKASAGVSYELYQKWVFLS